MVPSIVWIVIPVIFKIYRASHRVKNVRKIPLPIPVDCQFVTLVVVVKKQKKGVLNVPVVTRAKQELVMVARVNNV
jgi:hypothetical protein